MNHAVVGKKPGKPRILVAPLDWGLGHATRCIPIVQELLNQGCEPLLAGEGAQERLLKLEFPGLPFFPLEGYRARYGNTATGLLWQIFAQTPRFLRAIRKENQWLKQVAEREHIDAVISDNRYGLNHSGIPTVFITHQLLIKSPLGLWSEKFIQKRNYHFIKKFSTCWIPDHQKAVTLAGELAHPNLKPPIPFSYIGPLSRFTKMEVAEQKGHLLIIISGPEPQRSIFENMIVKQVAHYDGTATIVRGLPVERGLIPSTNMLQFYNHLSAAELNKEMLKAEYVVSRSGYSTVMDIAALHKKSILIPTPGQTEQEYLASHLTETGFAYTHAQSTFSLDKALEKANQHVYKFPEPLSNTSLTEAVKELLKKIS